MGYPLAAYFAGYSCSGVLFLAHVAKDFFWPGHTGDGLVLGLIIISVSGFLSNFCRLCALSAEMGKFSRRGITSIYKVSLLKKSIMRVEIRRISTWQIEKAKETLLSSDRHCLSASTPHPHGVSPWCLYGMVKINYPKFPADHFFQRN